MPAFKPKRALLSVSDKRGLIDLALTLQTLGTELVATGNTAAALKAANIPVTEVSDYTGSPEILDGRVKTLHPKIHAGLLARGPQDAEVLEAQGILPFDLLVVNLYPFEQVTQADGCGFSTAIENIDIGGPAMIRAAAKNHEHVAVVVNPDDYESLATALKAQTLELKQRFSLAKKAFAHTAAYDAAIANYLYALDDDKNTLEFPEILSCQFKKKISLRYGENPHQSAIFYSDNHPASQHSLALASILQGKTLSYNNLLDADAAWDCLRSFSKDIPTCVIVKHGNPCGIALGDNQLQAYLRAFHCDPISSYGGILAFNQPLTEETTTAILKQFAEIIIAPAIDEASIALLRSKPNIRVLITKGIDPQATKPWDMRRIDGGILVQEHDALACPEAYFKVVTQTAPSESQKKDLIFAWQAVKHVKSNAIILAKDLATVGIGAGQTSRVMSTRIALWQAEWAGFTCQDSVMSSDAFIPFPDSIELAKKAGIAAIIQPGGSIRDAEVIAAADTAGISMVFTGVRHFRH